MIASWTATARCKAQRAAAGLVDPADEHAKKPLAEHAEDLHRYLSAKGNSKPYVAKMLFRLTAVLASGIVFAASLRFATAGRAPTRNGAFSLP